MSEAAGYDAKAVPIRPTFSALHEEQSKTHEIISQLVDKLRPVLISRPDNPGATPEEVAPSQMTERVKDQELINRRLHSLLTDIDL